MHFYFFSLKIAITKKIFTDKFVVKILSILNLNAL